MTEAFICDAVRTPIGRFAGALARVRTDDLGAIPLKALMARNASVDPERIEEVFYGCAKQRARTTETWRAWQPSSLACP